MHLKEIDRTAVVAWGPSFQQAPLIATGTVAGALDASFSTNSELEIFNVSIQDRATKGERIAVIPTNARFNRLAWSTYKDMEVEKSVLAGGLEDGSVSIWDANLLMTSPETALMTSKSLFGGPVKGLHFNPHSQFLLAIGSVDAQLSLMDVRDPSKVYMPGAAKSQRLEDVTDLAWNPKVGHILAACSTNGATVVWDLRAKREAIQFSVSGQRGSISSLAWNPELPNQIVTASEDNANPHIYSWDLRNAHAPEKLLSGHSKGILSVAWCPKDPELLLSSGKDNRTIFWNPKTGQSLGELEPKDNWIFDVQWCPKNPDLLSTAAFDGHIDIYSFQSISGSLVSGAKPEDLFGSNTGNRSKDQPPHEKMKQVPKWLRCPVGARFGFGGKLCLFSQDHPKLVSVVVPNLRGLGAKNEQTQRVTPETVSKICQDHIKSQVSVMKHASEEDIVWTVLKVLNEPNSNDELLKLAGVSGDTSSISSVSSTSPHLTTAVNSQLVSQLNSAHLIDEKPNTASTTFADAGSFRPSFEETPTVLQSTQPDFFGEATEQDDFLLSSPTSLGLPASAENVFSANLDSGLGAGSSTNVQGQAHELRRRSTFSGLPFSLYASSEVDSDIQQRITRAIIAGNFKEAVELCIQTDKLSDALLVAVCGGPELVARTQRIYFQKVRSPYLRVVSGILKKDLTDVVENAHLSDWIDLFALVLSFGGPDVAKLLLVLADRLAIESMNTAAVVCYLTGGDVIKGSALILKISKASRVKVANTDFYTKWLGELLEKIQIAQLIAPKQDLSQIIDQVPDLAKYVLHYSYLLAESGRLQDAAYYYSLLLQSPGNAVEFADRLAVGSGVGKGAGGGKKAFEVIDVPVYTPSAPVVASAPAQQQPGQSSAGYPQPSFNQQQSYGQQQPFTTPYQQPSPPSYQHQQPPGIQSSAFSLPYPPSPSSQPLSSQFSTTTPYQTSTSTPYQSTTSTPYQSSTSAQPYPTPSAQPYQNNAQPIVQPYQQQAPSTQSQFIAPQPTLISSAEFSAGRTTEGFNDAPIVAPRPVVTSKSPQPVPQYPPQSMNIQQQSVHLQQPPQQQPSPVKSEQFEKKQFGPPDPSKMLPQHLAIYNALTNLSKYCEQHSSPTQKRIIEDACKRLQLLFIQLTHAQTTAHVSGLLTQVCGEINGKQWDSALSTCQQLTTNYFSETGGWVLGLKRLLEYMRGQ